MEILNDLSGVIFKKAELDNNFEKTYTKVFEKLIELDVTGNAEILEVLGKVSG
jgi:hypothetical protein